MFTKIHLAGYTTILNHREFNATKNGRKGCIFAFMMICKKVNRSFQREYVNCFNCFVFFGEFEIITVKPVGVSFFTVVPKTVLVENTDPLELQLPRDSLF